MINYIFEDTDYMHSLISGSAVKNSDLNEQVQNYY